jgi:hypothetical protein
VFLSVLRVELDITTPDEYVLTDDLEFGRPNGEVVIVPAGTVTDLDSVPRLPVVYILAKDRARASAALHDGLYYHGTLRPGGAEISRAEADQVFMEAMVAERLPGRHRWLIWAGVRIGGRGAWNRHRSARKRDGSTE